MRAPLDVCCRALAGEDAARFGFSGFCYIQYLVFLPVVECGVAGAESS